MGGAGLVSGASYSSDLAVFETGARHTFDEGTGTYNHHTPFCNRHETI